MSWIPRQGSHRVHVSECETRKSQGTCLGFRIRHRANNMNTLLYLEYDSILHAKITLRSEAVATSDWLAWKI